MDIKILENLLQVTIDRGDLRNRHHQIIQKRIMVDLGLLKSGKVELQSRSIGETLIDGTAHSARYEESIHDGSVKPDSANYQEEANSETFVTGNDASEFVKSK